MFSSLPLSKAAIEHHFQKCSTVPTQNKHDNHHRTKEQRKGRVRSRQEEADTQGKCVGVITWSGGPGSSYIAEGVGPVTRGVDVAGRGGAVPVGVRDARGLTRVTGANPDHSWMSHTHTHTHVCPQKGPQLA